MFPRYVTWYWFIQMEIEYTGGFLSFLGIEISLYA